MILKICWVSCFLGQTLKRWIVLFITFMSTNIIDVIYKHLLQITFHSKVMFSLISRLVEDGTHCTWWCHLRNVVRGYPYFVLFCLAWQTDPPFVCFAKRYDHVGVINKHKLFICFNDKLFLLIYYNFVELMEIVN